MEEEHIRLVQVRHVAGNVLRLAIPLTLRVVDSSGGTPVTTDSDFIPNSDYPVEVVLSRGTMEYSYQAGMDGNVASMEDLGELEPGTYSITVLCRNDEGEPMRFKQRQVIQVVDATAEAGIESGVEYQAETHCLNAAIFWSTSGWASGTLPSGIVIDPGYVHTDNNFTDEHKEMLEGGTETTTQTYTSDALTIGKVYKPQDIGDNNPVTGNSWRYGIFQAQPGDVITLTTDGYGDMFPALIFYNGNTYISHIAQNVYGELDVITNAVAPAGTTRIVVNCYRANDPSFSLEISRTTTTGGLYQRVSTLEGSVSTLQEGMESVEALPDIVEELQQDMSRLGGQTTTDYTRDDLIYGKCVYPRDLAQDNPSTLGSAWYYGFFQVQRGDVVTLVTDGYGDSVPPLLAFNGDTYVSSIEGNNYNVVDDEISYTVPAGVTQIAVNCYRGQISKFAMSISSLTGLAGRVSSLEDSTESLENRVGALEGATAPELKERVDVLEGNIATPSTVTRKVLVIGNSYSYDAFTYLPAVVSEAEPELSTDWVVGICMDGSQTLEGHYTNHAVNGTTFTRYSKISSAAAYGAWTTDYSATLATAYADEQWDLIVFHQASNLACDYSSIETPLANLIAWFKAQGYGGKFGWLVVPSFPDGTVQYTKTDGTEVITNKLAVLSQTLGLDHTMTSDEMESRIMDVAHKVQRNNTDISVVLPAGVALQMARKSALNRFGECVTLEGNMPQLMYKDGHHLQMGIANLTESWAIALTLLNGMVAMADIDTPRWPHGDRMSSDGLPVGLDSESQALARQCARQALDYYWRNYISSQSGGQQPSNITIADVEGLQSELDGFKGALTTEQETAATSTDVTGYLYSGGYFYAGDADSIYHCFSIPCSAGQKYRIYNPNGFDGAQVSLLWMVFNATENLSNNRSAVIDKSTGTTTGAHGTFDVTIATGGVMLYVAYYTRIGSAPTVKLVTEEYAGLQELRDDVNAAAASADAARSAATNAAAAAASAQDDVDELKEALATEAEEAVDATDVTGYLYINHYFYPDGKYHCKVVNVSEGEKYRIDNSNGFSGGTASALYMVFNNADNVGQTSAKIMESSQTTGTQGIYDITIPTGGVVLYVAYYPGYEVTVRKITSSYAPVVYSKALMGTFARTVVLGDSISTLVSGNSLRWSDYVAEQLGVTIHNYAIGGANIAGMQNTNLVDGSTNRNLIYQISRLPANMASVAIAEGGESDGVYTYTVDNLIISMGFNDANNNRTIGDYDTVVAADWTTLEPATTTTNFASIMAAVKWAIFRLKSSPITATVDGNTIAIDCTKARIIWQTPIQCSSNGNWASLGGYAALNNKIVAVEEAIVQICNHYGVPVIVGRTASGISTEVELLTQEWNGTAVVNGTGKYLRDGIHPNDDGMKLLGQMNLAGLLGAASNQSDTRQSGGDITIADVTGLQSALNAKQDALTSQTALGGVNGETLNYGGAVVLTGEDIPLSGSSSINVKNAIALINNNLAGKQDTLSFGTGLDLNGNEVSVNTASAIASGETGYATGGQVFTALADKQDTIAKGSVTIATSDWSSNAVTVTATGVTASNVVIVSPDSASMANYAAAGVQCTAQGANELTFSCTSTPTSSLTINFIAL